MTRFERWAIWITSVATFVTGVIYLWMKYLVVSDDPLAVVNHPWQPAVLKALFGQSGRSLDAVFDGLADFVDLHFQPGRLTGLIA